MKRLKKMIETNVRAIVAFIIGIIIPISGLVYATTAGYLYDSDEVSYTNTTSGLTSNDVQAALDELKSMCLDDAS